LKIDLPDKCRLRPQPDSDVVETDISFIWMKDDILYSTAKKVIRTKESVKSTLDAIQKLSGGKKVLMLAESNEMQAYENVPREKLKEEFEKHFKAVAIVTCTPMSKMLAHVHIARNLKCPVKIFNDPEEAKEWLEQYK
jgi:hypothetical protein